MCKMFRLHLLCACAIMIVALLLAPWSFVASFIRTPFGKGPAPFSCGSWAFAFSLHLLCSCPAAFACATISGCAASVSKRWAICRIFSSEPVKPACFRASVFNFVTPLSRGLMSVLAPCAFGTSRISSPMRTSASSTASPIGY